MRKIPGIGFTDSVTGRRAVLTGTGIEVWEIVAMWRSLNESEQDLQQAYAWLPATQVRSALAYYRLFPDEIDARMDLETGWDPESIRGHLPTATFGPGIREDR